MPYFSFATFHSYFQERFGMKEGRVCVFLVKVKTKSIFLVSLKNFKTLGSKTLELSCHLHYKARTQAAQGWRFIREKVNVSSGLSFVPITGTKSIMTFQGSNLLISPWHHYFPEDYFRPQSGLNTVPCPALGCSWILTEVCLIESLSLNASSYVLH